MTIVFVSMGYAHATFTFDGEVEFEHAAQQARLRMPLGDVQKIDDIFVVHVKDMTRLDKPVLGWGS